MRKIRKKLSMEHLAVKNEGTKLNIGEMKCVKIDE
jgi:hypothetical protein